MFAAKHNLQKLPTAFAQIVEESAVVEWLASGIWNMVECPWVQGTISSLRTGLFTQGSWISELSLWYNWNNVESGVKPK